MKKQSEQISQHPRNESKPVQPQGASVRSQAVEVTCSFRMQDSDASPEKNETSKKDICQDSTMQEVQALSGDKGTAPGDKGTAPDDNQVQIQQVSDPHSLLPPWKGRAILLVDLDAFFASVEQLDHPGWRGKPVIVGGDPNKHGVVSTASYEARAFGVRSAMPSSTAQKLCPQAIWTESHFNRYTEMSRKVMDILWDETPLVQQVSVDEAFLDVTPTAINTEHPVSIAERIQARVAELGITCSVGVGSSKSVAKVASDQDKPCGLTAVFPGTEKQFLSPLPVRAMSGIGRASEERLKSKGIHTLGDIMRAGEPYLEKLFGKNGVVMYTRACGLDDGPLQMGEPIKSISHEVTYANDLIHLQDIEAAIAAQASKVGRRLRKHGYHAKTLSLRVKYDDRSSRSVQVSAGTPTYDEFVITAYLVKLLPQVWSQGQRLRLVGVAATGFDSQIAQQESLFGDDLYSNPDDCATDGKLVIPDEEKRRDLLKATDLLKDKFGEKAVRFGNELRNEDNTTNSGSRTIADYQ